MEHRIEGLLLLLCVASAAALVGGPDAAAAEPSTRECPDLAGTYEPHPSVWFDRFHFGVTRTPRPETQSPQLVTFQRRDGGYTLIWHIPRQDVLAGALSLAERDPRKYGVWLDMVLRDPELPLPLGVNEQVWFNRLANYGPVFRVDAVLPLRECESGWFLLGSGGGDGPPVIEGGMEGTRNEALWLGRDPDGSLRLKLEERRKVVLVGGRYLNEVAIPLWSRTHLEKWPAAPEGDLAPLRAEELPEGDRPSSHVPACQITDDHEAVFFQRLEAHLPPKVEIENRSSSIIHGRMRPDGICDPTPYTVTISAPDAAAVAKVEDYLRTDPFIRQIDSQESQLVGDRLRVRFRMMAAP